MREAITKNRKLPHSFSASGMNFVENYCNLCLFEMLTLIERLPVRIKTARGARGQNEKMIGMIKENRKF